MSQSFKKENRNQNFGKDSISKADQNKITSHILS